MALSDIASKNQYAIDLLLAALPEGHATTLAYPEYIIEGKSLDVSLLYYRLLKELRDDTAAISLRQGIGGTLLIFNDLERDITPQVTAVARERYRAEYARLTEELRIKI